MTYKVFAPEEINNISSNRLETISISEDSSSACLINFMTGIKSLGNIKFFDISSPASFGLTINKETKYSWEYNKNPLTNINTERPTGIFLSSSASEYYKSSTNDSYKSHSTLYDYSKGYLYREDNELRTEAADLEALNSSSTGGEIDIVRLITLRRDLYKSNIDQRSLKMEIDLGLSSATGAVAGSSTSLTTALDIKNPYFGEESISSHAFFGVPWTEGNSLDTATGSLGIEAIIRPYKKESILLWRRLASEGWAGSEVQSQNSFIKLELAKSPDNRSNGFRFYIRSSSANGDFSYSFAEESVQASGFFSPEDVGINLYDGKFHHIAVSWSMSGIDGVSTTGDRGAGHVFGYIDGYKLENKDIVMPVQYSSDGSFGAVPQANMYKQSIPIKTSPIQYVDTQDSSPSGNNLYIGVSNYNREINDTIGDRGDLAAYNDELLAGGYDGQIQHMRIWSTRLVDGTSSITENINSQLDSTSQLGKSFANFYDSSITAGTDIKAWWIFNELETLTANDVSSYSNTGVVVGNSNVKLYNQIDRSRPVNAVDEDSLSSVNRVVLYNDQPEADIINNSLAQGRITRQKLNGNTKRVGLVYYDLGFITLDDNDTDLQLNYLWPASGTTGDFGFNVTGNGGAFNFERVVFDANETVNSTVYDSIAEGSEFNETENETAINPDTGELNTDESVSYITSVGLYNDNGDLLAIGKLSVPAKKNEAIKIIARSKIDF